MSVVHFFINEGEASVKDAEKKAGLGADAIANLADLEAEETPETMIISVLTNDLSDTGRTDRDNYVKWLRFLWESYRSCLEVLKNNPKLEVLHAETVNKALKFCMKYKRKVEFRRVKEHLKSHWTNAQLSYMVSPDPEQTLRRRLDIRMEQLNAACDLELWQLAFESAEDFHQLVSHPANRKALKGKVMMNYYGKVSQVFWVSENYLFHACAMQQIFVRSKRRLDGKVAKGEVTQAEADEQLRIPASKLLLATLAVPLPSITSGGYTEPDKDKHQRMATLVQHSSVPQRRQLVNDIVTRNVTAHLLPELGNLHRELEGDFDPMTLSTKIAPLLKFIEGHPELGQYLAPLKKMVLIKLVQQLALVYVTMRIADFAKLADFMSLHDCEKFIVEAVTRNQALVRLDHKNGTIILGDRGLESEGRRSQLTNLAKGLQTTLDLIHRDLKEQARAQKAEAFKQLAETLEDERKMMSMRRQQIEQRKEIDEQERAMQAQREAMEKKQQEEERRLEEERRVEEGKRLREEAKLQEEKDQKELAEKKRLKEHLDALKAEEAKKKGKAVALEQTEDVEEELKNIDKEELLKRKKEQEEKLKREAEERMASNVMKLDHLERARREKERPLLGELLKKQIEEDKVNIELQKKTFLENHKKKHVADVAAKGPLMRMLADKDAFEKIVAERRKAEHAKMMERREQERKVERERRKKEEERKAEQERREAEEREAKERAAAEAAEAMKQARQAERERLDEMARKQREREAEIESRQGGGGGGGGGDADERGPPRGGSDRWGGGDGERGPPRGERGPPRGDGDRWGGGGGGGFGDRGERDERGPPRGGDRWGGGGGGGGFGDRDDRGPPRGGGGDRYPRRDDERGPPRGGSDRWGGGGGGFGDRGERGERGPPRGDGDRWGGGGDRGPPRGGGGGDRWGGGFGPRRDDDGPRGGFGDRGGGGFGDRGGDRPERPRLNLQPRSAPREDRAPPEAKDDDGFATVQRKR